jgi:hypothetical protein
MKDEIKFANNFEKALGEENLRNFKRKVIGRFSNKTTRTLGELAMILDELNIVKEGINGVNLLGNLKDKHVSYKDKFQFGFTSDYHDKRTLYFEETKKDGAIAYKITKHHLSKDIYEEE